jgi:hypothetical protein
MGGRTVAGALADATAGVEAGALTGEPLTGEIVGFATTVPGGVLLGAVAPIGGRSGKDGEVLPPKPSGGVNGARSGCPLWGFGAGIATCAASGSAAGFGFSKAGSEAIGDAIGGAFREAGASAIEVIAVSKIGVVVFTGALSVTAALSAPATACDARCVGGLS